MDVEKTVYLCRHGETESNFEDVVQGYGDMLNECGVAQAMLLSKRLLRISRRDVPIEIIYSSIMTRAFHTATIIGEALNLPVHHSRDLMECLTPSQFHGHPAKDPEYIAYKKARAHIFAANVQISDEETFAMVCFRAQTFERMLRKSTSACAVVVTHNMFLTYLLNIMRHGKDFTPEMFLRSSEVFENTAVVKAEYGTLNNIMRAGKKGWRIWTGDARHLGNNV